MLSTMPVLIIPAHNYSLLISLHSVLSYRPTGVKSTILFLSHVLRLTSAYLMHIPHLRKFRCHRGFCLLVCASPPLPFGMGWKRLSQKRALSDGARIYCDGAESPMDTISLCHTGSTKLAYRLKLI